jgi:hypothetical protein
MQSDRVGKGGHRYPVSSIRGKGPFSNNIFGEGCAKLHGGDLWSGGAIGLAFDQLKRHA